MKLPAIKICGLTRAADARHAAAAGAEALGFVHHAPSPRHVDAPSLPALVRSAPDAAWRVLVLVDARPEDAQALCEASGATAVQLCGSERAPDWGGFPLPILRRVGVAPDAAAQLEEWRERAAGFVLDHPATPGGSGRTVDPDLAATLAGSAACLLAGGLSGANVGERVAAVHPVGVDASSALESAPGIKDPRLVEHFIRAARAALQ